MAGCRDHGRERTREEAAAGSGSEDGGHGDGFPAADMTGDTLQSASMARPAPQPALLPRRRTYTFTASSLLAPHAATSTTWVAELRLRRSVTVPPALGSGASSMGSGCSTPERRWDSWASAASAAPASAALSGRPASALRAAAERRQLREAQSQSMPLLTCVGAKIHQRYTGPGNTELARVVRKRAVELALNLSAGAYTERLLLLLLLFTCVRCDRGRGEKPVFSKHGA